jgi:peroxiredoxin Q/BCP
MRALTGSGLSLIIAIATLAGAAAQVPDLKPGDVAPGFTLPGSDGRTYRLGDYTGVKPVVLAWFPRAPIKD